MRGRLFAALLVAACTGCTTLAGASAEPQSVGEVTPLGLQGLWQSDAPGWVLSIGPTASTLYDVTEPWCAADPAQPLDEIYPRYRLTGAKRVELFEAGKTTYEEFRRIDDLPAQCRARAASSPQSNFAAFAAIFGELYPFFGIHGIDWPARVALARGQVSAATDDARLFDVFAQMLAGLDDGHVRLLATIGDEPREFAPYPGPTLAKTDPADAALRSRDPSLPRFLSRYRTRVLEDVLRGEGKSTANGLMLYGRVGAARDIGYINLIAFDGLADADDWLAQRDTLKEALAGALSDLASTRALIFDVSNNRGGVNVAAQAAAGFFTDRPRRVASLARPGQARQPITIEPQSRFYGKPVYLLTSDVTVSAGETFTLSMRAFPQVVHVGERTRGAMSKILPKTLPNGWTIYLSNQSYFDAEGTLWEGRGIPPEIAIPVFDRSDPDRGHVEAVSRVVALAERSGRPTD